MPLLPRYWNLSHRVPDLFDKDQSIPSSELVALSAFRQRVKEVGEHVLYTGNGQRTRGKPIVDAPLIVDGHEYHFLLTARPSTPAELGLPGSQASVEEMLKDGSLPITDIQRPHLRGFFAGIVGDDAVFYYPFDLGRLRRERPDFLDGLEASLDGFETRYGFRPALHEPKGSLAGTAHALQPLLKEKGLIKGNNGEMTPYNTFLFPGAEDSRDFKRFPATPEVVALEDLAEAYEAHLLSPKRHFISYVPFQLSKGFTQALYAPIALSTFNPVDEIPGLFNYGLFLGLDDEHEPSRMRFDAFKGHDVPINASRRRNPAHRYERNRNARFAKRVSSELSDLLGIPISTMLLKTSTKEGYRLVPVSPQPTKAYK